MLESLECVNEVVIFDSNTELENIIKHRQVETIILGEEYTNKKVIGWSPGIGLHFFPKVNGYSTTKIIENSSAR
jgi:bifunctional ADP-heptose synthase (sugar kinase/adenylyltransferase)